MRCMTCTRGSGLHAARVAGSGNLVYNHTVTRRRRRFAVLALAMSALLVAPPADAQFPIPNVFNAAKDAAVRQALSQFGQSIGAQLPIVVNKSDAYPTAALPGRPFAPGRAPNTLAGALRASADGTVALAPGDYEFTVGVFCMKSYAHSPSGHRYVVAPLHGAAADVFRALNSRVPSYALDHRAVQVLSWDIQAGLPYTAMQPAQRGIVDRVIPDFKNRLSGDVYERIRSQYDQTAGRVPGMPSFEGALGRLGAAGQAVVELQTLRQLMMQPPRTYEELAREVVPFASLIPSEAGGSGATPWSRYSDRVFVRFVTAGNYATPGTYQVRVLPPSGTMQGGGSAGVPFANIVNNPGNDGVQPLTQAVQGANNPMNPQPTPTPPVSISSQTVATTPSDRTRLTLGVGEEVILTFSGANAHWSIAGGAGSVDPIGKHVTYRASITPATETITATDTATSASATITFTVIAPTAVADEYITGSLIHDQNTPLIEMYVLVYFEPDTVSFQNIDVKELDAKAAATGVYSLFNGWSHNPNPVPAPMAGLVQGKGTQWKGSDHVGSGDPGGSPPFAPGSITFDIPYVYGALANGKNGPFYPFSTVVQQCKLDNDRETLHALKAGAHAESKVSNPENQ